MDRFQMLRATLVPALRPYVTRIVVFGSYARGEETPGSDIDVLVELKAAERRPPLGLRWFTLEEELSARLGRRVEMVTLEAMSPYCGRTFSGTRWSSMPKDDSVYLYHIRDAARLQVAR